MRSRTVALVHSSARSWAIGTTSVWYRTSCKTVRITSSRSLQRQKKWATTVMVSPRLKSIFWKTIEPSIIIYFAYSGFYLFFRPIIIPFFYSLPLNIIRNNETIQRHKIIQQFSRIISQRITDFVKTYKTTPFIITNRRNKEYRSFILDWKYEHN